LTASTRSDRFIGSFRHKNLKTGELTGTDGYIALVLSDSGRIPQLIISTAATLDELLAVLRGPRRHLMEGGKLVFEPPAPFHHHSPYLIAETAALSLEEIYHVQAQFAKI
jgi:hypothetical protein